MSSFKKDLIALLNAHSQEGSSDTPDFILAQYLMVALNGFESAVSERDA